MVCVSLHRGPPSNLGHAPERPNKSAKSSLSPLYLRGDGGILNDSKKRRFDQCVYIRLLQDLASQFLPGKRVVELDDGDFHAVYRFRCSDNV